jgi:nucleolar complex protein 3
LETFIYIFKNDLTGVPSLEAVRLINRMIKERNFNIHPKVLSCLSHLRLRSELGSVRASERHADKQGRREVKSKKQKGVKMKDKPYVTKKAKKVLKEMKAIQAEMEEAEAEVDKEERANQVSHIKT